MLFRQCSFKTTFFDSSKTSYFIAYPGLIQLAKIAALDGEFVNKGFKNCQWIVLYSLIYFITTRVPVLKKYVNLVRSVKALATV